MTTSLQDRLKLDISSYEKAKEAFLKTSTGKQLVKKVNNARNKQKHTNFSICCRCIRIRKRQPPSEGVDRVRYFEDKLTRATEKACKGQLLRLKATAKEARTFGATFQDDKRLKKANVILYKDKYRKNLLRAIESKNKEQLETSISKVYGREPLAVTLRHELGRAEQCLAYVTRRERARKGSTWKFEYEPDQAGYNLSYWVGSDQYWLRDRYRKTERRKEERIEEEEDSSVHKQDLHSATTAHEALSRTNEQNDENTEDDFKGGDVMPEDLKSRIEEEESVKEDESDTESSGHWTETESHNGTHSDNHPLLCIKKYTEELQQAMSDRDVSNIKTLLAEIYDEDLQSEMPGIVSDAENLLRQMAEERRQRNRVLVFRKELSRGIEARNAPKIRETLGRVHQEQVEDKLHKEVEKAEDFLRSLEREEIIPEVDQEEEEDGNTRDADVANLRQMLKVAGNVSSLEMAIRSVLESGLRDLLQSELADATKTLDKLKERDDFKKSVAEIPARYVSEVRSYVKPAPGVYQVMKATFLLLGFAIGSLQTWKDIQTHLGKTGTDSFRYRVIRRITSDVNDDVINAVNGMLKSISLENAQNLSLLVNLFYRYCQAVVSEKSSTK